MTRASDKIIALAAAVILSLGPAALAQEESGSDAESQGGGLNSAVSALPGNFVLPPSDLEGGSAAGLPQTGVPNEAVPAPGFAPLPAPAADALVLPAAAETRGTEASRSEGASVVAPAPLTKALGSASEGGAPPRGSAPAEKPRGRETLLESLSAPQPDWSAAGDVGAAAEARDDFDARAQLATSAPGASSDAILRKALRAVSNAASQVFGDATPWSRYSRFSAEAAPYQFEMQNRAILRAVAEAARQEALHGEEPGTREIGSFSALKTTRQAFGDCAVHAWYNNAALRPVRQALDYDDFLDLCEISSGVSLRTAGTSPELQARFLSDLGYRVRNVSRPSETELLSELRKNSGGINIMLYWRLSRALLPLDNLVGHEAVINGAYLERGKWRFIVTDSHYATPQVYTYGELAAHRGFDAALVSRAAGPEGQLLTDAQITARVRELQARGLKPPPPRLQENQYVTLFRKIFKAIF
ncbi:MAG: hypothetical protein KGL04_01605 [Elusimicrobia bacterium]|nr:hypothetical protein [Elusimicrobiota bacterium]